jgi:hypothetical protein
MLVQGRYVVDAGCGLQGLLTETILLPFPVRSLSASANSTPTDMPVSVERFQGYMLERSESSSLSESGANGGNL